MYYMDNVGSLCISVFYQEHITTLRRNHTVSLSLIAENVDKYTIKLPLKLDYVLVSGWLMRSVVLLL